MKIVNQESNRRPRYNWIHLNHSWGITIHNYLFKPTFDLQLSTCSKWVMDMGSWRQLQKFEIIIINSNSILCTLYSIDKINAITTYHSFLILTLNLYPTSTNKIILQKCLLQFPSVVRNRQYASQTSTWPVLIIKFLWSAIRVTV